MLAPSADEQYNEEAETAGVWYDASPPGLSWMRCTPPAPALALRGYDSCCDTGADMLQLLLPVG